MSGNILSTRGGASSAPAFLFDLDGTLVDSVYQHVLAWREALERAGISLSVWRIHRRIGMSGGLLINALLRETGREVTPRRASGCASTTRRRTRGWSARCGRCPAPASCSSTSPEPRCPGPSRPADGGRVRSPRWTCSVWGQSVTVITRDQVRYAKPDPDLFVAAAEGLGVSIESSVVVGDSVWDLLAARRAVPSALGCSRVAMGRTSSMRAGAYRVYEDPADLLPTWTRSASGFHNAVRRSTTTRVIRAGAARSIRRRCAVARSRRNASTAIAGRNARTG